MTSDCQAVFLENTKIPLNLIVEQHICILLSQSSPSTNDFSDDEYLELLEAIFAIHFLIYDSQAHLSRDLLTKIWISSLKENDIQNKLLLFNGLSSLLKQLKIAMHSRLQKCLKNENRNEPETNSYIPRLERLSLKLDLSTKEKLALQYIVLNNIGIRFPSTHKSFDRGVIRNMAIIANMSSREVLNFLSPNRRHIKDGLFESSDDVLSYEFSGTSFKMSKDTLSALMGSALTAEQFLMVDNTALGDILIEEGIIPQSLPSSETTNKQNTNNASNNTDVDTDLDVDVFEIIKNLAKDENRLEVKIDTEADDRSVSPALNELQAYDDDLDYLKDHFKVIELRMKIYVASLDEEDSYKYQLGKGQKTKLRELKSQEKQAFRKCVARLQINKQVKNAWLPRLEKLVTARNLDEFEKWVLLSLIGCIISVDIMKAVGRYKNSMTVGEMLALNVCLYFCRPNL